MATRRHVTAQKRATKKVGTAPQRRALWRRFAPAPPGAARPGGAPRARPTRPAQRAPRPRRRGRRGAAKCRTWLAPACGTPWAWRAPPAWPSAARRRRKTCRASRRCTARRAPCGHLGTQPARRSHAPRCRSVAHRRECLHPRAVRPVQSRPFRSRRAARPAAVSRPWVSRCALCCRARRRARATSRATPPSRTRCLTAWRRAPLAPPCSAAQPPVAFFLGWWAVVSR